MAAENKVLTCPLPSEEPPQGCSAARMWRSACSTLVAPDSEEAWEEIEEASPPDTLWHSLKNCVSYQAGVWQNLLTKGIGDVIQPAAFKLAIVMRHTPTDLVVRLLSDLLRLHPQSQDLTSYIVALLTDDEAHSWGSGSSTTSPSESSSSVSAGPTPPPLPDSSTPDDGIDPPEITDSSTSTSTTTTPTPAGPAPLRDLQLFGDCELAVLAASREEYDAHAKLVRAEYSKLSQRNYVELRVKVLNQLSQIPKLFNSPEFECFESAARENIEREICTLREHLLTGRAESS